MSSSTLKRCCTCKINKPINEFYGNSNKKYGVQDDCKECTKKAERIRRTMNISSFISQMYANMKSRCDKSPTYIGKLHISRKEFAEWAMVELPKFVEGASIDISDGYTNKGISIDKINDELGYITGNLQFMLLRDNSYKASVDYGLQKPICKYGLEGDLISTHISIHEAARSLGNAKYHKNISACLRGKQKTAYGFLWKYKKEEGAADVYKI